MTGTSDEIIGRSLETARGQIATEKGIGRDDASNFPGGRFTLRVAQISDSRLAYMRPPSEREKQVLGLLCSGLSTKQIAYELNASPRTIETHRSHLLRKFEVRNTAGLVAKAVDLVVKQSHDRSTHRSADSGIIEPPVQSQSSGDAAQENLALLHRQQGGAIHD